MRSNPLQDPLLIAAVALALTVASIAPAGSLASLGGRVVDPDGMTPRAGVRVGLVDERGELRASSLPTRGDGAFLIENAPEGSYGLMVDTPEGAFASRATVDLRAGANPPLALSLEGRSRHYEQTTGLGSGDRPLPRWARWTIAGGIGVAALLVIADSGEDSSESAASPF